MLAQRPRELAAPAAASRAVQQTFLDACRQGPIALVPALANAQH
jgi:hypothetical protein